MTSIIVHGGAYAIPDDKTEIKLSGCQLAAKTGHEILASNGSAVDAVEAAVRVLEDDPAFNAGRGSKLNIAGEVEMDAIIMDGSNLDVGAVAGVRTVANPISLARKVMEKTEHTMIIGRGADMLARELGIPEASQEDLISPEAKSFWDTHSKYGRVVHEVFNKGHDTVGAVARDHHGNVACATSTGGITLKRVGRVGDSPLIGCGGYSDNNLGGVSCTGHGESITRAMLAYRVLQPSSLTATESVKEGLRYMWDKVGGRGGLIMITSKGEIVKGFTTERMAWASIDGNGILEKGVNGPAVNVNKM